MRDQLETILLCVPSPSYVRKEKKRKLKEKEKIKSGENEVMPSLETVLVAFPCVFMYKCMFMCTCVFVSVFSSLNYMVS